jgi:hypothetical protein
MEHRRHRRPFPRREVAGSAARASGDGTLAAVTDPAIIEEPVSGAEPDVPAAEVPEEEVELSGLESDMAVIEAAMDQVDSGNLDVADEMIAGLGDTEA